MELEILLAVIGKLCGWFFAICLLSILAVIVTSVIYCCCVVDDNEEGIEFCKKGLKKSLVILLISIPFTLIPSVNDLWEARIGLIKLRLASPENVQASTEEIARIAKKLECKYIGCKDDKK